MKIILGLLLLAANARAALVIYNFTGTIRTAGAGIDQTTRQSGVLIWDIDGGRAYQIARFTLNGRKSLIWADQSGATLYRLEAGPKEYMAVVNDKELSRPGVSSEGHSFTFGVSSRLEIGGGTTTWLPKTAKSVGWGMAFIGPGTPAGGPATGFFSLSAKQTQDFNNSGRDIDFALQFFFQKYAAMGYVDVTP